MRRMNALVGRALTIETYSVTVMLWGVLAIWRQITTYQLFIDPFGTVSFELPFQLGLVVAFGTTYFLWMSLCVFGYVGTGTGAGFRLALLGLVSRICGSVGDVSSGSASAESSYVAEMRGAGPIWWARNLGLASFGCGLALVVLASAVDLRRRRRGVRWMALGD